MSWRWRSDWKSEWERDSGSGRWWGQKTWGNKPEKSWKWEEEEEVQAEWEPWEKKGKSWDEGWEETEEDISLKWRCDAEEQAVQKPPPPPTPKVPPSRSPPAPPPLLKPKPKLMPKAPPAAPKEPEGVWPLGSHRRPIGKLSQSAAQLRGLAQPKPMPRPPDAPPDALEAFAEAMELNAEAAAALRAAPPAVQRRVLGEAGEVPKGRSASAAVRFRVIKYTRLQNEEPKPKPPEPPGPPPDLETGDKESSGEEWPPPKVTPPPPPPPPGPPAAPAPPTPPQPQEQWPREEWRRQQQQQQWQQAHALQQQAMQQAQAAAIQQQQQLNLMAMTLQNLAMAPAQAAQAAKGGAEQAIKVYAEEEVRKFAELHRLSQETLTELLTLSPEEMLNITQASKRKNLDGEQKAVNSDGMEDVVVMSRIASLKQKQEGKPPAPVKKEKEPKNEKKKKKDALPPEVEVQLKKKVSQQSHSGDFAQRCVDFVGQNQLHSLAERALMMMAAGDADALMRSRHASFAGSAREKMRQFLQLVKGKDKSGEVEPMVAYAWELIKKEVCPEKSVSRRRSRSPRRRKRSVRSRRKSAKRGRKRSKSSESSESSKPANKAKAKDSSSEPPKATKETPKLQEPPPVPMVAAKSAAVKSSSCGARPKAKGNHLKKVAAALAHHELEAELETMQRDEEAAELAAEREAAEKQRGKIEFQIKGGDPVARMLKLKESLQEPRDGPPLPPEEPPPEASLEDLEAQLQGEHERAAWEWLKNLDGGRGGLLRYFEVLRDEFDCDFAQLAAARLEKPVSPGALGHLEPSFFQALGVEQVGHRLLLARGILALEQ